VKRTTKQHRDQVLKVVAALWAKYPKLRLCQLLGNATIQFARDPYYVEDERLMEMLKKYDT